MKIPFRRWRLHYLDPHQWRRHRIAQVREQRLEQLEGLSADIGRQATVVPRALSFRNKSVDTVFLLSSSQEKYTPSIAIYEDRHSAMRTNRDRIFKTNGLMCCRHLRCNEARIRVRIAWRGGGIFKQWNEPAFIIHLRHRMHPREVAL